MITGPRAVRLDSETVPFRLARPSVNGGALAPMSSVLDAIGIEELYSTQDRRSSPVSRVATKCSEREFESTFSADNCTEPKDGCTTKVVSS